MTRIRRTVVVAGLAVLVVALLSAFFGLDGLLDTDWLVALAGNDYVFVVALSAVGLLVAVATILSARHVGRFQATVPDPERPYTAPPPGADLDEATADWRTLLPVLGRAERQRVREQLRAVVVETLGNTEGCTTEEAERRVEAGTWTDDPWARSFVGECAGPSLSQRVRALAQGDPGFRRHVHRTVAELAHVSAEEYEASI